MTTETYTARLSHTVSFGTHTHIDIDRDDMELFEETDDTNICKGVGATPEEAVRDMLAKAKARLATFADERPEDADEFGGWYGDSVVENIATFEGAAWEPVYKDAACCWKAPIEGTPCRWDLWVVVDEDDNFSMKVWEGSAEDVKVLGAVLAA